MTELNTKTESSKDSGKTEYIRLLNAMNHPQSDIATLINNIKDARKKLDGFITEQKELERAAEKKRRELEKLEQERLAALKEAQKPAQSDKKEEAAVVSAPKTEKHEKTEKQDKKDKPAKEAPSADNIRTKQFDNTPSYIKGKYTPIQPEKKPLFEKKPRAPYQNQGQQNRQGAPRQPYAPRTGTTATNANNYQNKTANGTAKKPFVKTTPTVAPPITKERKGFDNKRKDFTKSSDEKKTMNKRTLIRKGFIQENMDDERSNVRKLKNKKVKEQVPFVPVKIEKAVITTENLTVKILSEKIGITAQEIIKQLMILGIMTNINSVVDFPTMELVANELGVQLELKLEQSKEEIVESFHDEVDKEEDLVKRPPIITVMGHVDHGKTSLLDSIRKTSVVSGEAGGITQHIGAYSVTCHGEKITFLDTPGHEAFTEMRARGAKVTDIAVLVVAADDGVMPQTIEAINHAKAANTPIIVAINKIDKPAANIDKIKQMLTEQSLVPEEWGGDTMMIPISAKQGQGIDKLLESILLLAEVNTYRANPKRKAKATIIEAKLDKGKGAVANIIIQNGTLKVGDTVVSGIASGRVRAMVDDKGRSIKEAGPSTPISILGFTEVPDAGDSMFVVDDDKIARQVVDERMAKIKNEQLVHSQNVTLDDVLSRTSEGQLRDLNIIIKADVQGSVEALKNSLSKLVNDEVRVKVVHGGVGTINKSDLMLAEVSKAVVIGFNVRPDSESKIIAESSGINLRTYRVIYEAIDDITMIMKGMLTPKYKETISGRAQVRNVFKITGSGMVAGCYILNGKITRNSKAKIYRGGEVIFEGNIQGLKRFKDDVKEVAEGYECGISIDGFSDIKENDEIEAYSLDIIKD